MDELARNADDATCTADTAADEDGLHRLFSFHRLRTLVLHKPSPFLLLNPMAYLAFATTYCQPIIAECGEGLVHDLESQGGLRV